jgi:hypothetical protein
MWLYTTVGIGIMKNNRNRGNASARTQAVPPNNKTMPMTETTKAVRARNNSAPSVAIHSWSAPYTTMTKPHQFGDGFSASSSARFCHTMKPTTIGTKKP